MAGDPNDDMVESLSAPETDYTVVKSPMADNPNDSLEESPTARTPDSTAQTQRVTNKPVKLKLKLKTI